MAPPESFDHKEYRDNLAKDLKGMRAQGEAGKEIAKQVSEEEQETLRYKWSKDAHRLELQKDESFNIIESYFSDSRDGADWDMVKAVAEQFSNDPEMIDFISAKAFKNYFGRHYPQGFEAGNAYESGALHSFSKDLGTLNVLHIYDSNLHTEYLEELKNAYFNEPVSVEEIRGFFHFYPYYVNKLRGESAKMLDEIFKKLMVEHSTEIGRYTEPMSHPGIVGNRTPIMFLHEMAQDLDSKRSQGEIDFRDNISEMSRLLLVKRMILRYYNGAIQIEKESPKDALSIALGKSVLDGLMKEWKINLSGFDGQNTEDAKKLKENLSPEVSNEEFVRFVRETYGISE